MPTFREARDAIANQFTTQFHNARSEPIAFDNFSKLVNPDGSLSDKPNNAPWVKLSIRMGSGDGISFGKEGSRVFRHSGVTMINVFIPSGQGDGLAYTIADAAAKTLRGVDVNGVQFFASDPPEFVGTDGGLFQLNTGTDFEFDLIA